MLSRAVKTSRNSARFSAGLLTASFVASLLILTQGCGTAPVAVRVSPDRATLLAGKVGVGVKRDAQGRVDHIRLEIQTDTSSTLALGNVFDMDIDKEPGFIAVNLQRLRADE